ncbi:hypothetical protein CBR_g36884 [Chara braunii]|uniref:Uncharacterized protein n=1 Tax=Chara braunii TaxID=69332 RepID=A0A388LLS0_CHABU|nr:hypothetical protein CBR_g36884 [Chara braunii]|eukprot:GBG83269.1 hypothetical protein CBR_g36884 [Chara braunii]
MGGVCGRRRRRWSQRSCRNGGCVEEISRGSGGIGRNGGGGGRRRSDGRRGYVLRVWGTRCGASGGGRFGGRRWLWRGGERSGEAGGLAAVLLGFSCSKQGKSLILDVVISFVGEAISVYIEQTRDVNIYDDIVTSVTKPANREPVKDLMKSVCNEAVGTLVRTSYDVLSSSSQPSDVCISRNRAIRRSRGGGGGGGCRCLSVGPPTHVDTDEAMTAITLEGGTSCCVNYDDGEEEDSLGDDGAESYGCGSGSTNVMVRRDLRLGSGEDEAVDTEDLDTEGTSTPRGGGGGGGQDADVAELDSASCSRKGSSDRGFPSGGWQLRKGRMRGGGDRRICTKAGGLGEDGGRGGKKEQEGWIDKACKVITVPNNREFVMDVAGAVSFQSVRAFIIAFNDVLRRQRRLPPSPSNGGGGGDDVASSAEPQEGQSGERISIGGQSFRVEKMRNTARFVAEQLRYSLRREPTDLIFTKAVKFVAAKALVCTSACLAICLHTIAGVRTMEALVEALGHLWLCCCDPCAMVAIASRS